VICTVARLDDEKLESIRSFERQTGKRVLALTCHDLPVAELKESEVRALQDLERRLGVVLLSYR
jgi:hypothetical protein